MPIDTEACSDADTKAGSPYFRTPTHTASAYVSTTSAVFIVKTLAKGGTLKYRSHCDPTATLAELRTILHNDEDHIMCSDDRFRQGQYCVGKGSEPHTKWKDILEVIHA
jgi:hypothetical protein